MQYESCTEDDRFQRSHEGILEAIFVFDGGKTLFLVKSE